jgi:hypothetical protein
MITIKDWMEVVNYRITEGDTYGWNCYGHHAHQLSAWNGIHGKGGWSLNIVFDTQTQEVYEVAVCDYTNDRAYRFINPIYKTAYNAEAKSHGEFANQAWDGVDYTDLEVDEDWLDKATSIVDGEDYDTRVSVPLDFTDEELLKYMTMAHERDMTFNAFVEEALRAAIEDYKRDPEGMKAKADRWKADHDLA